MFHGRFAVTGKVDRSEGWWDDDPRVRGIVARETRYDNAEFLGNSRGRKSRNSRGHPLLQGLFGIHVLARSCRQNLTHGQLNATTSNESRRFDSSPKTRESRSVLSIASPICLEEKSGCCTNLLNRMLSRIKIYRMYRSHVVGGKFPWLEEFFSSISCGSWSTKTYNQIENWNYISYTGDKAISSFSLIKLFDKFSYGK